MAELKQPAHDLNPNNEGVQMLMFLRAVGAGMIFALAGCATTSGLEPTEVRSGFDGATVVDIQPHGAACRSMTCIAIGAQWTSNVPESAMLTVAVMNSITAINGAAVSIDGKATTLQPMPGLTTYSQPGEPIRESRKSFTVPLALVRQIADSGRVWVRVSTPAGSIEDPINSPDGDSKALHALRRFLARVDAAVPKR